MVTHYFSVVYPMFKHTQLCFHSTSQLFCPQHVAPPRGAPHLMVAEDPDVESVPAAETAAVESDEAEVQKNSFDLLFQSLSV